MKKLLEKLWNFAKEHHIFTIIGILSLFPTCFGVYCGFLLNMAHYPYGNSVYHTNMYTDILFHFSSIISAIFIVCIGKKLLQKKDKICEFAQQHKQLLISCWINISYFIYMSQIDASEMLAIRQGVYPPEADSIAIPMFSMLFYFIILGFFYYCLMNVFLKKLYLNELSQKTTKIIAYTLIVVSLIGTPITAYYSYHVLILEILEVIWIMIMLFIVRYNSELSQNEDTERKNINFSWILFISLSIISFVFYFIPILGDSNLPFIVAIILTFVYTDKLNNKFNNILNKINIILKKILLVSIALLVLICLGTGTYIFINDNVIQPRTEFLKKHPDVNKSGYKYIQGVQKKIKKNWKPYDKNKGVIKTFFKINSDGEVYSIKIIESNTSKNNEDKAIEAIKKSAPFKPLPKDLNKDGYVDIEFTFDYK